jgi:hypothetical protein
MKQRVILSLLLVLLLAGRAAAQETTAPAAKAAFTAYACTFQKGTNSVQVSAALMGSNGEAVPANAFTLAITPSGASSALAADRLSIASLPTRPPLQMILVVDTTDTVPLDSITSAITGHLLPDLDPADEVAVITFGDNVSPRSSFYTDKGRLADEQLANLKAVGGDNRVYDAILAATDGFPAGGDKRKVIVVLTDSDKRKDPQASIDDIISKSLRAKIEIYPIAFYTRDRPNPAVLGGLANSTGGYGWFYTEKKNSRASIEEAVSKNLDALVKTLNSEVTFSASLSGQKPDAGGRTTLNLSVTTQDDGILNDAVSCPVETLKHSITFAGNIKDSDTVTGPLDIAVSAQTDLNPDQWKVVFRVNDEAAQTSEKQVYTFDPTGKQPGLYTIGAQLIDKYGELLATTPSAVRLYAQQALTLRKTDSANGAAQFEASAAPNVKLPEAVFRIAPNGDDGGSAVELGRAAFGANGKATLNIDDLTGKTRALLPAFSSTSQFIVSAVVPGVSPGDPALAASTTALPISLNLTTDAAAAGSGGTVSTTAGLPPLAVFFVNNNERIGRVGILLALLVFNYLLLRTIRRARILRLIKKPDAQDLSPQLMAITVRRGDVKQSHTLTKKTVFVGRGASNDINLGDDLNISRQHGAVMWRRGNWYYANRKRQAVTRINGKRYRGLALQKLEPVTEIEIAGNLLIFHSSTQQDLSDFIKTNL